MHVRRLLGAIAFISLIAAPPVFAKDTAGFDAFLASDADQSLAVSADSLSSREVRVDHREGRLGLPTFLWATGQVPAGMSRAAGSSPEQAARAHLGAYADLYRITPAEVGSATLKDLHNPGRGAVIARFGQSVNGIEVFRNELKVVMNAQLDLVAITGYLAPSGFVRQAAGIPAARAFQLSEQDAIAKAFAALTKTQVTPSSLVLSRTDGAGYGTYELATPGRAPQGWTMTEPARVRRVYYTLADRLEPAFYVEVTAGKAETTDSQSFSFVLSARDGSLLMRNNLTADLANDYTYRVWADPASRLPYDGPQGTDASPHPTGTPNGYQAPLTLAPNLVTLSNYPFSQNDPWLAPQSTQTTGNNVDAYVDLAAPDGYQPGVDLRGATSGPATFDYVFDVTRSPSADTNQRMAAVTNLFYLNNFLHDWYYDSGFDEKAGNAQAQNFGRGGLEGDPIKAEAQDYGGRNNSNMSTPADGARPRMQMFVFDGRPSLVVNAPAGLAGMVDSDTAAGFGLQQFDLTGELAILDPAGVTEGCSALPPGTFTGKIALLDRGSCSFTVKAAVAQSAGAIGVIIANTTAGVAAPGLGGTASTITIPVLSTTKEVGGAWKTAGGTVNVTMKRVPDLDRDGTLDNDIVAHEWAHYLSNRLIGNGSGLVNQQGGGMGEGWSDFNALLLQVRPEDVTRPGNGSWQGVYALAGYTQSGGANNGYYFGIRRVPYSTDLTKNGLTYKHISANVALPGAVPAAFDLAGLSNYEVHETGEVWATMLWECYASLLRAYPFQEAQDRMKSYLVASLKATPSSPTVLEARDALLAVAAASDPADYSRFAAAFARRGAGFGAKGPDRNSYDQIGAVESFQSGSNLEVSSITLDDAQVGCDKDGVLDLGETGNLTVTVRNSGGTTLSAFSGTVTAAGATSTLAFPGGNVLSFGSLAPGATQTRRLPVQLTAITGATPRAGLTLTFDEPSLLGSARTATYDGRVHYDEVLTGSSTDSFDGALSAWDRSPAIGASAFTRTSGGYMHAANSPTATLSALTSPWIQLSGTDDFSIQASLRWSFESTFNAAPFFDGAVVQLTDDGVNWYNAFEDLRVDPGYRDFLAPGDNPLGEVGAFVGTNAGFTTTAPFPGFVTSTMNFGTLFGASPVRIRFLVGSDSSVGAYGFDVDDFQILSGAVNAPFGALVAETSDGSVCHPAPVANPGDNRTVNEGTLNGSGALVRTTVTLNGTASFDPDGLPLTYSWTQLSGPPATLSGAGSATPTFVPNVPWDSVYSFQLVVSDANGASTPRRVDVTVRDVNQRPVALAAAPAMVDERSQATITLDGTGSSDLDPEQSLSYAWTQISGPPVTLSGPNSALATFPTPEVTADTQLVFSLVVNDGLQDSTLSTVAVTVKQVDRAPTVSAGLDLSVAGRSPVTLTAVGTDADGDAITYAWTARAGNPVPVVLTGASSATAQFTSPDVKVPTTLTFDVTVTANGGTSTDSVDVAVGPDSTPTVSAGSDRSAASRSTVVLRGSATDPEGDAITYAWNQQLGTPVVLSDADTATPTFIAPSLTTADTLVFQVTVTANGLSSSDTVAIEVLPEGIPSVDAGDDLTVAGRSVVLLRGAASVGDGSPITYQWTQLLGDPVLLQNAGSAVATFVSPDVKASAVLVFQLTALSNGQSATDTVTVTVGQDGAPVVITDDQDVDARAAVTLHASATDPENDAITYAWSQLSGDAVNLQGATSANPTFTAPDVTTPAPADLVFAVVASANGVDSTPVTATVHVHRANRRPVVAGVNHLAEDERTRVTLAVTSSDADGDALTYSWTQQGGPSVTLEGAETASASFVTPEVASDTTLSFSVTATDGSGAVSEAATVQLLVKNVNRAPTAVASGPTTTSALQTVVLDASGSSDPDFQPLSYRWKQTAGAEMPLSAADKASVSFVVPKDAVAQTLTFELTVTDAAGLAATSTVSVDVTRPAGCSSTQAGWQDAAFLAAIVFLVSRRRITQAA